MPREHVLEMVTRTDGTVAIYLNGKPIQCRWLNVHTSVSSKRTEVVMEVFHEPLTVEGDDVKNYLWTLTPCRVVGELPARLF